MNAIACPTCGATAGEGPYCRMCGSRLTGEDHGSSAGSRAAAAARTLAVRIRERTAYAVSSLRMRSAARSEVLSLRAQLDRIGAEIRTATYELGQAALRDDPPTVARLRAHVAALEGEAVSCRARIDAVIGWATRSVERERLAVQPTRVDDAS